MDNILLARIQFGMTIGFHFLFPPISIGLAWLVAWLERKAGKTKDTEALGFAKFFGRIFAIFYVVGIGTGIVMSLQFGTNWGRFATFVNGVFGPMLVAEVLFAFFLESVFFGVWLVGRGRVPETLYRWSIRLVAIGATLSAFFIVAADSWLQTPAGYAIEGGRAILTDFGLAVFNPSTLSRFLHVMMAAATITGFFVAGISAYLLLKRRGGAFTRNVLAAGVGIGALAALLVCGSGIMEAFRISGQNTEKTAVFRGLPPGADAKPVTGFSTVKPAEAETLAEDLTELPPSFSQWTFWTMIILGGFFFIYSVLMLSALLGGKLQDSVPRLWSLVFLIPLPWLATESGWISAEVGRQPWVVAKLLRTSDAVSVSVSAGMITFSLILIALVYVLFLVVAVGLIFRETRTAFAAPAPGKEAAL